MYKDDLRAVRVKVQITSILLFSSQIKIYEAEINIQFVRYVLILIVQMPVIFYPLQVVGRSSETQLEVGEKKFYNFGALEVY